jgi:ABC-2 type transport system permease protein
VIVASRLARDRRRSVTWWAVGVVGLMAFTAAFFPAVEGEASFDDLVKDMPEAMRDLFGMEGVSLGSAPGYLHARVFSTLLPLLLVIFGVGVGARAIGGAEDEGTLELLLAQPVTRRRVLVERYVAMVGMLALLGAVSAVSILAMAAPVDLLAGVSLAGLLAACAAATLLALVFATLAFAGGAAFGRRSTALAIGTVAAVATYLHRGVVGVSDPAHALRWLSPWHWYVDRNMLVDGIAPDALLVPPLVCLAVLVAGLVAFERRDLH